ncbi:MAG: hypothetical protein ACLPKT_19555 [Methylocella sp.]
MTLSKRAKLGIALAIAVLAGLTSGLAGMLVLVLAWLLIVWGQAPERTETFIGALPGGNYLLRALARIDRIFWPPDLRQRDFVLEEQEERAPEELGQEELGQEELGQEDTAQGDEANLAQEEYFREILRGYGPEARRRLRQLNITGDPRSVLDEEWVQYLRDGLVETTHSGRGGVRSDLRGMIGKLLDEFQDGP